MPLFLFKAGFSGSKNQVLLKTKNTKGANK